MPTDFSTAVAPLHGDLDTEIFDPVPDLFEAWRAVCETLAFKISTHSHRTYVASAQVLESDGPDVLRLGYSNQIAFTTAEELYKKTFAEELERVLNRRVEVRLECLSQPKPSATPQIVTVEEALRHKPAVAVERSGAGEPPPTRRLTSRLDTRYGFDSFVVGASNQFAHAAAKAVADKPGRTYNPLFIWGGVGLGKTHLMQAVGLKALSDTPSLKVLYTTSEQFTNELIQSLRTNQKEEFRRRYRDLDLLLIDDIQFIAKKSATEEEFFHTFNELHSRGKQIIVTSDTVPNEIVGMEERLRSRFQWGLVADVQPPDMETRIAILKSKAQNMRMELDDEVAQFLALHVRQNVRELEGSLVRLLAYSNLISGRLTVEVCKDLLKSILPRGGGKLDCEQIMKASAEYFRISLADLKGPSREKQIARARQCAMYLSRKLIQMSFPELGRRFGRDHSTVMSAVRRVPQLMADDTDFRRIVETLERELDPNG